MEKQEMGWREVEKKKKLNKWTNRQAHERRKEHASKRDIQEGRQMDEERYKKL